MKVITLKERAYQRIHLTESVAAWAKRHKVNRYIVYAVLSGRYRPKFSFSQGARILKLLKEEGVI